MRKYDHTTTMDSGTATLPTEWYAIQTRSRHEKVVGQLLNRRSIDAFVPLLRQKRRWADRDKDVATPLFPGYVFVETDLENRVEILRTHGVVRIVGDGRRPLPVDRKTISDIMSALRTTHQVHPYPCLKEGCTVRVKRGPLAGCEGILIKFRSKHCLVMQITLIQQAVAVEVEAGDVDGVY
jgi:transcription antitermination factor NusG